VPPLFTTPSPAPPLQHSLRSCRLEIGSVGSVRLASTQGFYHVDCVPWKSCSRAIEADYVGTKLDGLTAQQAKAVKEVFAETVANSVRAEFVIGESVNVKSKSTVYPAVIVDFDVKQQKPFEVRYVKDGALERVVASRVKKARPLAQTPLVQTLPVAKLEKPLKARGAGGGGEEECAVPSELLSPPNKKRKADGESNPLLAEVGKQRDGGGVLDGSVMVYKVSHSRYYNATGRTGDQRYA